MKNNRQVVQMLADVVIEYTDGRKKDAMEAAHELHVSISGSVNGGSYFAKSRKIRLFRPPKVLTNNPTGSLAIELQNKDKLIAELKAIGKIPSKKAKDEALKAFNDIVDAYDFGAKSLLKIDLKAAMAKVHKFICLTPSRK